MAGSKITTIEHKRERCSVSLGGAVDDVYALSVALVLIEEPDTVVSKDEIALARDRLTWMLYSRAQDLNKEAEGFV